MAKKGALTGLLLFGIFFGAGNLIFPPSLGALSGEHFLPAIAGFVFSGVGIAVLTLIIGTLNPKRIYLRDFNKDSALVCDSLPLSSLLVNWPILCHPTYSYNSLRSRD